MLSLIKAGLINDPEICVEIECYRQTESKKLGVDIGFEKAAEEWVRSIFKERA